VESIARRGLDALRYGPLRPVGLRDPKTGRRPYAALQLRREDAQGTLLNLVGCQTRLTFPEQRRVFGLIPALAHAEYASFGVMHRNTFLDAPRVLGVNGECKTMPGVFFAGQITGVEGYVPSAASGLTAGLTLARRMLGQPPPAFPPTTALGALARHTRTPTPNYQPMAMTWGLMDLPDMRNKRNKKERAEAAANIALDEIRSLCSSVQSSV